MIYYISPYAEDKRLGVAFNEHIKLLPNDAWICSTDGDAMFLTPDYGQVIAQAVKDNPNATLMTCTTNRGYGQRMLTESDIIWHYKEADRVSKVKKYTQIRTVAPAFMWLFPKKTWINNRFDKHTIIHGFDSFDTRWIRNLKGSIVRIDHLYCFHYYRLHKSQKDHSHLK